MPRLLSVISVVGVAAMLWVGGHILLNGIDELGWHAPYDAVHHLEDEVHHAVEGIGAAARLAGQHRRLARWSAWWSASSSSRSCTWCRAGRAH